MSEPREEKVYIRADQLLRAFEIMARIYWRKAGEPDYAERLKFGGGNWEEIRDQTTRFYNYSYSCERLLVVHRLLTSIQRPESCELDLLAILEEFACGWKTINTGERQAWINFFLHAGKPQSDAQAA